MVWNLNSVADYPIDLFRTSLVRGFVTRCLPDFAFVRSSVDAGTTILLFGFAWHLWVCKQPKASKYMQKFRSANTLNIFRTEGGSNANTQSGSYRIRPNRWFLLYLSPSSSRCQITREKNLDWDRCFFVLDRTLHSTFSIEWLTWAESRDSSSSYLVWLLEFRK